MTWSYEEANEYLEGHVNFEQQSPTKEGAPSLDRVRALAAAMGDPQACLLYTSDAADE